MTDVSVTSWPLRGVQTWRLYTESSINLSETLSWITHEWKTAQTYFLARLFIYINISIIFHIPASWLNLFFIFYFIFDCVTLQTPTRYVIVHKLRDRYVRREATEIRCRYDSITYNIGSKKTDFSLVETEGISSYRAKLLGNDLWLPF